MSKFRETGIKVEKSKFAALKIEDDEDEESSQKIIQTKGNKKSHQTQNKPKNKQTNVQTFPLIASLYFYH